MTDINVKPSDIAVVAGIIDPDAYAASTVTTGWINMADFEAIQAIVMAGTLGVSATLNAKLEQATSSGGAGAKDITGKAITALTQAGTDDDKQAIINCRAHELDVDGGFTHVRLSMTIGVAASDAGGIVLGHNARYQPEADIAAVDEVVGG
jgi:hypothetical protein